MVGVSVEMANNAGSRLRLGSWILEDGAQAGRRLPCAQGCGIERCLQRVVDKGELHGAGLEKRGQEGPCSFRIQLACGGVVEPAALFSAQVIEADVDVESAAVRLMGRKTAAPFFTQVAHNEPRPQGIGALHSERRDFQRIDEDGFAPSALRTLEMHDPVDPLKKYP